jgi:hypothetical protein
VHQQPLRRNVFDSAATRCPEDEITRSSSFHRETFLVHQPMMNAAEQHEVLQLRLAAICPMFDVVGVGEALVGAARKAAALVAGLEGSAEGGGDCAGLAADVEGIAVDVFA